MALLDLMKTGMALAQTAAKAASQKSGATGTAQAKKTPAATSGGAWTTGKDALGQTDYSVLLKNAMTAGASAGEVQDLLTKRTQKALSSDAYSPYAKDDVYREAQAYIDAQRKPSYDLSDQIRKAQAAKVESALADLKGAYAKGMSAYDAKLEKLPERYQAARNSAAAQAAMAKKNFDEQAAASGLNSGASGQAALDASAVLRGNLSDLHQAQAGEAAELDRAKADLTAQYEAAVAKARAEGDASLANALYQEMVRVQGLQRADEQTAYDRGRDTMLDSRYEQQYTDSRADVDYERKATKAAMLAQMGNFGGYAELWGLTPEETATLVANYARQQQISEQQAALELDGQRLSNELLKKQIANYGVSRSRSGGGDDGKKDSVEAGDTSGTHTASSEDLYRDTLQRVANIGDNLSLTNDDTKEQIIEVVEQAQRQGLSDEDARRILAQYSIR